MQIGNPRPAHVHLCSLIRDFPFHMIYSREADRKSQQLSHVEKWQKKNQAVYL